MKKIFLESHNINNPYFGFGQFNHHLLKALVEIEQEDFKFIIHGKDIGNLRKEYGKSIDFKKYHSFRRYHYFAIRDKYDLWHSLNQNTKFEPYHNLPYLLTIHNITYIKDHNNYRNDAVHKRFQTKINRSNAITYISNYAKISTHKFFNIPNVPEYVIYNGNPIKEVTLSDDFEPSIRSKKPFLFSIGEFTERKNFKSLVHMLELLPEFNLILAGKNSTSNANEIRQLIAQNGFGNRVFLPGKISEAEKKYFYQNCTAFVFPSLREGFGLPIIEAMRFGKPIFTSRNTSLPEIGGDFIFYWTHYEKNYMAKVFQQGMKTFLENKDNYIENLLSRAKSFDWKNSARQYMEVYRALL